MLRSIVRSGLGAALLGAVVAMGCGGETSTEANPDDKSQDVAYLIEQLNSKNPTQGGFDSRIMAANLLARQGAKAAEAIPHLEKFTSNSDPKVAEAARNAIEKIRSGEGGG